MAVHELPFRGHDESNLSLNKGNFKDLCEYTGQYNLEFQQFLENSTVFKGTSATIKNDLIEAVSNVLLREIRREIQQTEFVAVQLDETTDISRKAQLSSIIRFVGENGECEERFYKFFDVSNDQSADGITKVVLHVIDELNIGAKLVAKTYDGAPVMSGSINGVQAQIKKYIVLLSLSTVMLMC